MAVIKRVKNKNYTVMSNYHLRDKDLSLKAKGMMSIMLGLPDDWDYSINGLETLSADGNKSVRSCLKELEENKYLQRKKIRNENGTIVDWEYTIYEYPQDNLSHVQTPHVQNAHVENGAQLNTYKQSTKELNTKEYKENIKESEEIIEYLNRHANTNYRSSSNKTKKLIHARLAEGYTVIDFETVIKKKCDEWLGTDYEKYLRPETLFGTKFENYLNQRTKPKGGLLF